MRVAHKLSVKLGREILIGSTSCDPPATFLKSLQVCQLMLFATGFVICIKYENAAVSTGCEALLTGCCESVFA